MFPKKTTVLSPYLIPAVKVTEVAKRGHPLTLLAAHPVANEVDVVAALGQQRERTLTLLVPVAAHKRVGKVPETHLEINVLFHDLQWKISAFQIIKK
jgi:hypothetical protein